MVVVVVVVVVAIGEKKIRPVRGIEKAGLVTCESLANQIRGFRPTQTLKKK